MSKNKLATYIEDQSLQARRDAEDLAKLALNGRATDEDLDGLDEAIETAAQMEAARAAFGTRVTREPMTYVRGGPHSYITDLWAAGGQAGGHGGATALTSNPIPGIDPEQARARLQRHKLEVQTFYEVRNQSVAGAVAKAGLNARGGSHTAFTNSAGEIVSQRAGDLSNVAGAAGEFLPPTWYLEYFASVARSASTVRNLIGVKPLPDETLQLNIPRLDSAVEPVEPQNLENSTVTSSEGTTSDSVQAPVITLAGKGQISLQMLERGSGVDEVFLQEFAESWASGIENQIVNGTGGVYQFAGLANLANLLTVTTTATDGYGYIVGLGQSAAAVSANRKRPVDALILNSRRYAWLASAAADANGDPILRPGTGNVPLDEKGAFGPVSGFAVYLSDSIPTNLGTGTNQDLAFAIRSTDFLLFESIPHFDVFADVNGYSNQLSVYVGTHGYGAFFGGRYKSTAVLTGAVVPTGY